MRITRGAIGTVLSAVLFTVLPNGAFARERSARVVLLGTDETLTSAVASAVAAWEVEVSRAAGRGSDAEAPEAAARRHGDAGRASAVAWIEVAARGATLVVVDLADGRVVRRELGTAPPYDEATAAALALTVKNVLATTSVSPVAPRPAPASVSPSALRLEVAGLAGRSFAEGLEGRGALGLSYWASPRVGMALVAAGGPGRGVATARLDGTLVDLSASLAARAAIRFGRLGVELGAGPGVHALRLAGTVGAESVTATRVDPAVVATATVEADLGERSRLGVMASADLLLRTQRYLAGGVEALTLGYATFGLGLRFSVRVD